MKRAHRAGPVLVFPARPCAGCGSFFRTDVAERRYCELCRRRHQIAVMRYTGGPRPPDEKPAA